MVCQPQKLESSSRDESNTLDTLDSEKIAPDQTTDTFFYSKLPYAVADVNLRVAVRAVISSSSDEVRQIKMNFLAYIKFLRYLDCNVCLMVN